MSFHEKIKAIHARNNLSLEEKRALVYETKGNAFRGIINGIINEPWIDGDLTINITSFGVDENHRVIVDCEAWKGGKKVILDLPLIFVNAPLSHQGVESASLVLKHIVANSIRHNL